MKGRVIFCSGSPFPPVTYNGVTYKPGQGNNAYIFPGVALGVIATLMHHIPDDVFLIAARELASCVRDEDLEIGSLYPPLTHIREVSLRIAVGITKYAYQRGIKTHSSIRFYYKKIFAFGFTQSIEHSQSIHNDTYCSRIKSKLECSSSYKIHS